MRINERIRGGYDAMERLFKLNKLYMAVDIEAAVSKLILTTGLEREIASRLVAGGVELLLEEELGLIVKHRYMTSKGDLYTHGPIITTMIKNMKTDFWPLVIEHVPPFANTTYLGTVDLVHEHLIEIKIEKERNES